LIVAVLVLWLWLHSRNPLPRWTSPITVVVGLTVKVIASRSGRHVLLIVVGPERYWPIVVITLAGEPRRVGGVRAIAPIPVGLRIRF
jgi:hypothetical protein